MVVVISIGEMREGMQVRLKTITITIFWEGREGERGTFGFMLAVVVVVGVIVDFVVIVNDDDISVIFFRTTTTIIPCRTVFNENSSTPVQLFPTRSTQPDQFHSNRRFPLYYTTHTLPHPFRSTPPISHYHVHPALPHLPYATPYKM